MDRIPEPDLMNEEKQAYAYAHADFSEPHNNFIVQFQALFPNNIQGAVLDIGCGPGDISCRFAKAYPNCKIEGIDGSKAMLELGKALIYNYKVQDRVSLHYAYLPQDKPPQTQYDAVISNSLLHHLTNPFILWDAVKTYAKTGAPIFIMDLMRPETTKLAEKIVEKYAATEPLILQQDFFHSLCAAYTVSEIRAQLQSANCEYLTIEVLSDRHFCIYGRKP